MDFISGNISVAETFDAARAWVETELLTLAAAGQLAAIVVAMLLALACAPPVRRWLERRIAQNADDARLVAVWRTFMPLVQPIIWVLLLWLAVAAAGAAGWSNKIIDIFVSLLNAWIVIRLASNLVRDPIWARFIAIAAWTVAALNILDLLTPTLEVLDSIAVSTADFRISALTILKGVLYLAVLLWLANLLSRLLERRIRTLPNLTPSIQVLFIKLLKIILVTIAIVVAISSVGIDLTAFAVFGGALGVGIGFGLQRIVANLVSGVILLLDKSIKPGDTIGIAGTYGWIQSLGARYVSVITRDGVEHLIPNEELITSRVENWSFSNDRVRLKVPVGISYRSDVRLAMALCVEATRTAERVISDPAPACLLMGFGDSSVDLEIRFWIHDPQSGVSNVKSEVLLTVWDRFHENGIEIPFPQRDVHIKSLPPESVSPPVTQTPA